MNKNSRALRKRFFQKRIPVYRKNSVIFAREVLLFEPDEWQRAALMDLAENPKVAIKSGQGVGKTGLEAVALLWFLCCHPYPRIVATAPTKQQLHDVLWSEVSKWMSKSPLLSEILKWTKTYIYIISHASLKKFILRYCMVVFTVYFLPLFIWLYCFAVGMVYFLVSGSRMVSYKKFRKIEKVLDKGICCFLLLYAFISIYSAYFHVCFTLSFIE